MADRKYPQVLLLGNGINRAFGEDSWDTLLSELQDPEEKSRGKTLPKSLRAILVSGDNIGPKLEKIQEDPHKREILYGKVDKEKHPEQVQILQKILRIGFDHILTTNYSYELESAGVKMYPCVDDDNLKKIQKYTSGKKRPEKRYRFYTYNEVSWEEIINRIWHIHGEARNHNSIILGHYYYANLLHKYMKLLNDKDKNVGDNESWLTTFIHSDVYILGFGFDPSEMDLWWLLNKRKIEKEESDLCKILYYSPDNDDGDGAAGNFKEKVELLSYFGVDYCNIGMDCKKNNEIISYSEFYKKAIEDISHRVTEARR